MQWEKIKNASEILSQGDHESRKIVLEITERTLQRLDGYRKVTDLMTMQGSVLAIGDRKWDLAQKRNVYLIGAGKACNAMAMAVDHVLGDYLTAGIVIVKDKEQTDTYRRTVAYEGGHPLPTQAGVDACNKIVELVDQSGPDDLFICVISGGSTALMSNPVPEITLEEKIKTTDILLKSGASVEKINAVRRHLSQTNGGRLGQRIHNRGAELIGIDIYDGIGLPATTDVSTPVRFFGTPMGPDETTLEDARRVLDEHNLHDKLPQSVVRYLQHCGPAGETPKELPRFTYYVINTLPDAANCAAQVAREMGLEVHVLTASFEGESREAAKVLCSIAREIQTQQRPFSAPCVLVCTGETTTQISDNSRIAGTGGPSQELVASFATVCRNVPGVCVLSLDTDGTDGMTAAAGGIVDSTTWELAQQRGVDLYAALRGHATNEALAQLNGLVRTGNTGTNLCDLNIVYVPKS